MAQGKETVTIPFKNSTITGLKLKSLNGKEFYGFVGIRYAQPPVGDLRFKPPQPIEKYPKNIDATEFGGVCIQRRNVVSGTENIGNEDCLFMNIFIPQLPSKNQKLKPVLLKVMGGVYNRGRSHWLQPYPTTLIEYDVIYVNFVYRLHILGFLNLGLEECPGNVGLKDHAAALKWVVSNISYFGGDPDNITLHGTSSGANALMYLAMSPLTKGLFKKGIVSSPLAIYPWNIEHQPVERAFKFGRKLGFIGNDKKELLEFFKKQPIEDMFNAVYESRNTEMSDEVEVLWGIFLFRPSIEFIKEGAFLPESPFKLWKNVDSLSLICGFCENEGISYVTMAAAPNELKYADTIKYIMKATIRDSFDLGEEQTMKMYEEIERFYFSKKEHNSDDVLSIAMEFFTDYQLRDFHGPQNFMKKPQVETAYYYLFTYEGNLNVTKKIWSKRFPKVFKGTYHSDEYCYVVEIPDKIEDGVPDENDLQVIRNMTLLFTNFAKTGNPNCEDSKCQWTQTTEENPCYLDLNKELKLVHNEMYKNSKFWHYLMQKYCNCATSS